MFRAIGERLSRGRSFRYRLPQACGDRRRTRLAKPLQLPDISALSEQQKGDLPRNIRDHAVAYKVVTPVSR